MPSYRFVYLIYGELPPLSQTDKIPSATFAQRLAPNALAAGRRSTRGREVGKRVEVRHNGDLHMDCGESDCARLREMAGAVAGGGASGFLGGARRGVRGGVERRAGAVEGSLEAREEGSRRRRGATEGRSSPVSVLDGAEAEHCPVAAAGVFPCIPWNTHDFNKEKIYILTPAQ